MAALIEQFRATNKIQKDVDLRRRNYGWVDGGSFVVRFSGSSKLAVSDDSLLISQLPLVRKLMPAIEIPLESLSKVDSRFFWSALRRFDVFEINGISNGKLLLPVGLVGAGDRNNEERSPAT
jgi:hypothetical protein